MCMSRCVYRCVGGWLQEQVWGEALDALELELQAVVSAGN